ncbi:hypothetical protein EVG20_g3824 [Dentipellis fragilis]|uniref:Uncharacterized protein n=1 Tax=Dentipellis fragilis TaxID=205917 RepID=A0A4Y9YZS3_9AGAM|nr:hypothetical protein EVG20_g3824 [Dentipellis fragilis]
MGRPSTLVFGPLPLVLPDVQPSLDRVNGLLAENSKSHWPWQAHTARSLEQWKALGGLGASITCASSNCILPAGAVLSLAMVCPSIHDRPRSTIHARPAPEHASGSPWLPSGLRTFLPDKPLQSATARPYAWHGALDGVGVDYTVHGSVTYKYVIEADGGRPAQRQVCYSASDAPTRLKATATAPERPTAAAT